MAKVIVTIILIVGVVVAVAVFKNKTAVAPENGSTSPSVVSSSGPNGSPQAGSVSESPVFCTQDAKQCPDGSYVSRQGPNCEFAPCPTVAPVSTCSPRPACFDVTPSCKMPEPIGGWCPTSSPIRTTTPVPSATTNSRTVTISFANALASPIIVNIKVGDTVKFINNDSVSHWPASGPHPTHTICPGFDSLRGLNVGESYSLTFREAKTCPWHDHLKPSINGQIVVE
mgnify:CR=1 FL=1